MLLAALMTLFLVGQDQCNTCTDADGDGYCVEDDCDDNDPNTFPDAPEFCDGIDQNCNGEIDEGAQIRYYSDVDGDHYGNPDEYVVACEPPSDEWVTLGGDCDDRDPAINPGAQESCNGIDDNCDGLVDEGVTTPFYTDVDGDGFGGPESQVDACDAPSPDYIPEGGDCNDLDATINPGMEEVCDGIDNNCAGGIDEGVTVTFYWDADQDGYGAPASATEACERPSQEYITQGEDCNDLDGAVNPAALEICDSIDNNCDGDIDEGWMGSDVDTCCYQKVECGDWYACNEMALSYSAYMVAIRDGVLQRWLNDTFGTEPMYWIGYTDDDREGIFRWTSGDQSAYTNWAPGQPDDFTSCGEDYALMNWPDGDTPGQWNDVGPCSDEWSITTQTILQSCPLTE